MLNNERYGLKEVANVTFFDVATGKPVIFFDTLKVSSIENTSESAEARGGQGNGKLIGWDFGRTAVLTMQDALLSDISLSLISGNKTNSATTEAPITVNGREVVKVVDGVARIEKTPNDGSVTVYAVNKGVMQGEITTFTAVGNEITPDPTELEEAGTDEVMVFYTYEVESDATMVTFSANQFPATYKVVGDTVVRGQDGVDRKMQFIIPKAKLQTNFNLTMEAENVSTFDFTLDVLVEAGTNKLYDIVRVG